VEHTHVVLDVCGAFGHQSIVPEEANDDFECGRLILPFEGVHLQAVGLLAILRDCTDTEASDGRSDHERALLASYLYQRRQVFLVFVLVCAHQRVALLDAHHGQRVCVLDRLLAVEFESARDWNGSS